MSKDFEQSLSQLGLLFNAIAENNHSFSSDIDCKYYNNLNEAIKIEHFYNAWFTQEQCIMACKAFGHMLSPSSIKKWLSSQDKPKKINTIAVIAAGNIPMVGLHDILCILASGHNALIKLSSKDNHLIPIVLNYLIELNKDLKDRISFNDSIIKGFDAIIATGSNNSAGYFEQYFSKYPHIIRKNRSSIAVLTGNETPEQLYKLTLDIFSYFGLGCRSVSKIFIPKNYNVLSIFEYFLCYEHYSMHNKYFNNYEYNKAIFLIEKTPHYDNGFVLLKEEEAISSPMGVLSYEFYDDINNLHLKLNNVRDSLQCIIGTVNWPNIIEFGKAQFPEIDDYADQINTMSFLNNLN